MDAQGEWIIGYGWFVARDTFSLALTVSPLAGAVALVESVARDGKSVWPWLVALASGPAAAIVSEWGDVATYGLTELALPVKSPSPA